MKNNEKTPKPPSIGSIILSTIAAAFGVQSKKNQERDFTGGNIFVYIAAGIIFTIVFIFVVISLVNLVLGAQ